MVAVHYSFDRGRHLPQDRGSVRRKATARAAEKAVFLVEEIVEGEGSVLDPLEDAIVQRPLAAHRVIEQRFFGIGSPSGLKFRQSRKRSRSRKREFQSERGVAPHRDANDLSNRIRIVADRARHIQTGEHVVGDL